MSILSSAPFVTGIGVFLLGMIVLTEALRSAVGGRLHQFLLRFTRGRFRSVLAGVLTTTLLQSSSGTVMAVVGLAAAGCLPLVNAVGVVVGANLGTTSTAWIMLWLGFKLNLTMIASPLVAVGALLRLGLFGRRAVPLGMPLAGFGLLFVGLSLIQSGLSEPAFTIPVALDLTGFLLLLGVGIAMTAVMQSSSIAVVTTIIALEAGLLGLGQAAVLVVGQNLGTTSTALLASFGSNPTGRKVAWAHVLFNGVTALIALPLLALVLFVPLRIEPMLALAAFHTLFNLLGVLVIAPWLGGFTRLIGLLKDESSR